ncbi:thioredoxin family protein [Lutispora thermophila]|uniref:Glutaredoxin n=1 Tax=Lutispora thermophila DSM 19022 TaxID=1122184 RepID=A0A1M6H1W5_9FIRM|nr:thioredoxin family protein [Lutispora thermophila]SHJ16181.1 Glutaredoxin [Lutispora thermophila DSM 19022]
MEKNLLFILKSCPYCKQALSWMEELKKENPAYEEVAFTIIDEKENPDIADKYDYYLVPTYYVNGKKVHEGAASREIVENILKEATLSSEK